MHDGTLGLERWANFYLVTSAAAATLIGLLFVVITVAADRRPKEDVAKIRLYLTPTVILFASVLGVATVLTFPNHTPLSASLWIGFVGVVGLVYSGLLLAGRPGTSNTYTGTSERIEYVGLPALAYGLLVAGAVLVVQASSAGLTCVGAGLVALLALAIRNSWAVAITVVSNREH